MGTGNWFVRISLGLTFLAVGLGATLGQDASHPRLDRYGDPLPEGAVGRLGTLRYRHPHIANVAFSPNGSVLASSGVDRELKQCEIRLFDAWTGKVIHHLIPALKREVHNLYPINFPDPTLAFSPDGKFVAAGCPDLSVHLWDVQSGRLAHVFENPYTEPPLVKGKRRDTVPIAFSRDGNVLASAGTGNGISLWDVATGKKLHELRAGDHQPVLPVWQKCQPYFSLVFSADGKSLFSGGAGGLYHWDIDKEKEEVWDDHVFLWVMDLSKKGDFLAVGGLGHSLSIWAVAERKRVSLATDMEHTHGVAFSPDGKVLAAVSGDDPLTFYEVPTLKEVGTLLHYFGRSVAFSPDGTRVAAAWAEGETNSSGGASIRLWDVERGENGPQSFVVYGEEDLRFEGHHHHAECVTFLPDGKTVASSGWRWVRFWDVASQRELRRWSCGTFARHVNAIAVSPDGKAFAAAGTEAIRIREIESGRDVARFIGHGTDFGYIKKQRKVFGLAFSPDGKYGYSAGTVNFLKIPGGGSGGPARLWDARTGEEILDFDGPVHPAVAFSPDSKFLAGPRRGVDAITREVGLWEVPTGRLVRTFRGQEDCACAVAFSGDGRFLVSGGTDGRVLIWDVSTGDEIRHLGGHEKEVVSVAVSSDGKLLATASDRMIRIWQMPEGRFLRKLEGHEAGIRSLSFSPNGNLLASASQDTTVLVWDLAELHRRATSGNGGGDR